MEKVKGYTIKDIVTNNIELPANFSLDDFIGRVKEFLARMHEKRIYHRDLHWDNIMIEKGTGKIYIIDFGSSTSSFGDDESEIYREKTPSGETITFKTDEDEFKEVCKELRNYLLTN
jgi:tRNA A-37 threonylcarbamoyl transferase component Bud32